MIDIKLSERHFSAHLDDFIVDILDGDAISLVAAGPNHQVCALQVLGLLSRCSCLDQAHSFLSSTFDRLVHALGIAAESCERVEESVLVGELELLEVGVAVSLGLVNAAVEYSDAVPIQYRNVTLLKLRQVVVVDTPV